MDALGKRQRLNEAITGVAWPQKQERHKPLEEWAAIMRGLWAGETAPHLGRVTVQEAKLYTGPRRRR